MGYNGHVPTIVGDSRRIVRFHEIHGSSNLINIAENDPLPYGGGTLLGAVINFQQFNQLLYLYASHKTS
jgi:hypothetical protein